MTLSVALCTYNGERYLPEQLASISAQTHLPNEVIVVDDGSVDGSVSIVRQWAEGVSFPVHIHQNETNLGSSKSFERAALLCKKDVIVFSDQDDVWRTDRLAQTADWLKNNPHMDAVFSDADLINEHSQLIGQRIWEVVQFGLNEQKQWQDGRGYELLFHGYVVTGATLAIRRSVLPMLTPFPTHVQYLIHDAWMSVVLALKGTLGFINEPLIRYRQHTSQQVGFKAAGPRITLRDRLTRDRTKRLAPIQKKALRYRQLCDLLCSRPDLDLQRLKVLKRMADHLERRLHLPSARLLRPPFVVGEVIQGNYQLFAGHWWKTVLGDLLEP